MARDFFQSGFEHSLTSHARSAWARSPWEAVQWAAANALARLERPEPAAPDWTATDESPR
jgi:sugar/nucleoside kinase (ribokinase family)